MSKSIPHVLKHSLFLRISLLGFLIILLQIPLTQIDWLISDRKNSKEEAQREIAQLAGGRQVVIGPVISVPYTKHGITNNGEPHSEKRYL